jgi:hypothetical protein
MLAASAQAQRGDSSAQAIYDSALSAFDPDLLRKAEERGLYDRTELPVFRGMNPFFMRGDFNGDGELDLAFWVRDTKTQERGIAIVHSTLDRLYVFGAGRPRPPPAEPNTTTLDVDAWHLLPAGHTEPHLYTGVPALGLTAEQPFTFERETIEFVHLLKSAFAFYWAGGQYWEIWTAD